MSLTSDQNQARLNFIGFMGDPSSRHMVIEGFSGTGKTYLVTTLIDELNAINKSIQLLGTNSITYYAELTATTNKAVENLNDKTAISARTIYSLIGARMHRDYKTGVSKLIIPSNKVADVIENTVVFIDEASFADDALIEAVIARCCPRTTKVVWIGDPAQLAPVGYDYAPVFDQGWPTSRLEEVRRQANGNAIITLGELCRKAVETLEPFQFIPDGKDIVRVSKPDFEQMVKDEFTRPAWGHYDSKLLAWRNVTVDRYNGFINSLVKGVPTLEIGDYALVNNFVNNGAYPLKTDQTVRITDKVPATELGIQGHWFTINGSTEYFMPESLEAKMALRAKLFKDGEFVDASTVDSQWIDLRPAYASTINKSQGSTYNKAFIDLDDLKRCFNKNTLYRLLYVGMTRPSHQLILTGDL